MSVSIEFAPGAWKDLLGILADYYQDYAIAQ
ncbi:hypothetical protein ABIE59_003375 [Marinobacter sp. MBR-99]|jgi:hypothetical protein